MSAYLVEDDLIDYILTFMMRHSRQPSSVYIEGKGWMPCSQEICEAHTRRSFADWIGQMLIDANYASLTARYGDNSEPHEYRFREHTGHRFDCWRQAALQVIKACDNFDYQACETRDYEASAAHRIIFDIRNCAIRALPNYDSGTWGAPANPARSAAMPPAAQPAVALRLL